MPKRNTSLVALLPPAHGLRLEHTTIREHTVMLTLRTTIPAAACPVCTIQSFAVHSRYTRTVMDLPWGGYRVRLLLHVRKFFCRQRACARRIFTERLPTVVAPHARTTVRLQELLRLLAFALGGEAGARLSARLGMGTSPANLIALIRNTPVPSRPTPAVLGVDDWAKRKGVSYGTILVDLEARRVVDVLPERSSTTFAEWLEEHPGVTIISRDRGEQYATGGALGAPGAVHVADRWHLIRNWADVSERVLKRHQTALRQIQLRQRSPRGQRPRACYLAKASIGVANMRTCSANKRNGSALSVGPPFVNGTQKGQH